MLHGGQYYWFVTDRLGVPQKLVNTSGEVVWSGEFDAYGNCTVTVNTVANPLRLSGQYFDAETGLYYNVHRYYDPHTGRYLQTDPAGDGLNPYVYAAANPVNAIDPDGLCALRMYGGEAEMYVGASLFGAGPAGWFVGALMILNGADNLIAGGRSAVTGEYKQAFLEAGIHHYVQNDLAANLLYAGTQVGLGYAGIRVHRAIRAVKGSQIVLDESLRTVSGWKRGSPNITINRSRVRQAAQKFGRTIGQELQISAYHEAFHRGFYKVNKFVSWLLGVDDIYISSYVWYKRGFGKDRWFRMEERAAEIYGKTRMLLRQKYRIK